MGIHCVITHGDKGISDLMIHGPAVRDGNIQPVMIRKIKDVPRENILQFSLEGGLVTIFLTVENLIELRAQLLEFFGEVKK